MAGASVITGGTYLLELSTGYDSSAFYLDESLLSGYTTFDTRTNLLINPNLETNITSWGTIGASTTIARSTTQAYIGTASALLSYPSTTSGPIAVAQTGTGSFRLAVTAGTTYTFSVYAFTDVADDYRASMRFATAITGGTTTDLNGTQSAITVNTWTRYSVTAVAPVGFPFVQLQLARITNTVTGTTFVDAALFEEESSALPYFDGTYANTYTGYTLQTQAWNGTADASSSTATWGLNSSFITGPVLDGDGTEFVEITDVVQTISINRGRHKPLDVFGPGTMSVNIQVPNTNRNYDPFNTSSIYYNQLTEQPGLAPLREIRLSRNGEYLFTGRVTTYNQQYNMAGLTQYQINAADDIYVLSQGSLPNTATTSQTSSARITAVLSAAGYTGSTSLTASPVATLGAYTIASGTNVNAYLNRIQQAEQGRIFCSRANVLTAQQRTGTTLTAPVVTFNDTGTATPYDNIIVEFDQQNVINNSNITIEVGGTLQNANNSGSIAEYFKQTEAITDSLLSTDGQAATLASYLLYPIPLPRFTNVSTTFASLSNAQKTALAPIEIGDTVTATKTFASGTPLAITQDLSVEGIDHLIDFNTGHRMTIWTASTTVLTDLILDDITYGIIDSLNALG